MTAPDFEQIWQALPSPAVLVDDEGRVRELNPAAEDFLSVSNRSLRGRSFEGFVGEDSRIAALIREVGRLGRELSEYRVEMGLPDRPTRIVDISATPLETGELLLVVMPRGRAERMDSALTSRNAARSVVGMAQMLGHEIKNPLAGISGAAQLLEMNVGGDARELTELIRDECERIATLVGRVEAFGDMVPARREPVNIHDVLDRAAKSAKAGFAKHVRFIVDYDPSLPPTVGDADQLMQVMLNLLKNAAEAVPEVGGVISLRTSYQVGIKIGTGAGRRESLPLQISITDNGAGVPEDLRAQIFEPFVTSRATGSGLGLALVSKIVTDHGGVISCESVPGTTMFRMLLPVASGAVGENAA